jgi:hypothetical protein
MSTYKAIYNDLMEKHLDRRLTENDGYSESEILELENQLSLKMPQSMRDLYQFLGNIYEDPTDFLYLIKPEITKGIADENILLFMAEGQYLTMVGVKVSDVENSDPKVWVVDHAYGDEVQLSADVSLSEFVVRLIDDEFFMESIMEKVSMSEQASNDE